VTAKSGLKKQETSFYRTAQSIFQTSEPFRHDSQVWQ